MRIHTSGTTCIPALLVSLTLASATLSARLNASPATETESADATHAQEYDPHKPYVRYHFDDSDMDFIFSSLVLGAASNHGSEIGEAFYTASRIKDGVATSWQEAWADMAARVEQRGQESLKRGHRVSARRQLLRAANYYRFATLAMMPDQPQLPTLAQHSRNLTREAGLLFDPPLEYLEIPYENTVLPAFFRKAANDDAPRKTLLMIGGGETFAEDLIFYIMPEAIARGYNFATVDLPGQGLLPLSGHTFRPDMHVPIRKVIDALMEHPEVDPQRLAVYGISGGGGFAPQTAQHDSRISAVAMNSCVVDAYPLFSSMVSIARATPEYLDTLTSFHANTMKINAWRWGVPMDNVPGLIEANRGFEFDPSQVVIPALIMVGEGEYQDEEVRRQQALCYDGLPNPKKKLVITPLNEGASNHCTMENRSLVAQVVFDWLDEVFAD